MNRLCLLLMLGILSLPVQAVELVLVFTRMQDAATSLYGASRSQMIIGHLRRLAAGEVGLAVRTADLSPRQQARIKAYSDAGHLLINRGHHYQPLLGRPDVYRYQADLLRAHRRLQAFTGYEGHLLVDDVLSADHREVWQRFVRNRGLTPMAVSLALRDGHLNSVYQEAVLRNKRPDMAALEDAWVDMLWPAIVEQHYRQLASHGAAPVVLLLEENDLSAYFLPGLIERLRSSGGRLVSPRVLFTPPVVHRASGDAIRWIGGDRAQTDAYLHSRGVLL